MCHFLGLACQEPDVILNHVMFDINCLFERFLSAECHTVHQAQVVQMLDSTIHWIINIQCISTVLAKEVVPSSR